MAINTVTVTTAANFIPEIWSQDISDAVQANIVLADLVDRSFEKDLRHGDILHITDMANPAVRAKSADTSATYSNVTETMQNLTVDQHIYAAFLVEDMAEIQAHIDLRSRYTSKCGYSLMSIVEGDTTSGLGSLPDNFSVVKGTLGVDPTDDDLIACVQALDDADVPDDGRFLYCSPAMHAALLKIDKFTRQEYVGQADAERAVKRAMVGRVYNAPVYKSTLAANNPSAANQTYNWFCHKRGVALAMQQRPTTHADYVLLETGWGVLVNCIYGFIERLILPRTLASTSPADTFNVALASA